MQVSNRAVRYSATGGFRRRRPRTGHRRAPRECDRAVWRKNQPRWRSHARHVDPAAHRRGARRAAECYPGYGLARVRIARAQPRSRRERASLLRYSQPAANGFKGRDRGRNDLRAPVRRRAFQNCAELLPHGAGLLAITGEESAACAIQTETRAHVALKNLAAQRRAFEDIHRAEHERSGIERRQIIAARNPQNFLARHSEGFEIERQIPTLTARVDEARRGNGRALLPGRVVAVETDQQGPIVFESKIVPEEIKAVFNSLMELTSLLFQSGKQHLLRSTDDSMVADSG